MTAARAPVSSPAEPLILVDDEDREIGYLAKEDCHRGDGLLHRAFSVFLFNPAGELLLQQRSASKPLWPLYWSNSCCSHPRRGETVADAAHRRVAEELELACELDYLYKFKYHASFGEAGSEREFCWVYAGYHQGEAVAHPDEIAAFRYLSPEALTREIEAEPQRFTPWLKLEWAEICAHHLPRIMQRFR